MAKQRRRKKSNQQGVATLIFILALLVIGGGLVVRYAMNEWLTPKTERASQVSTGESAEQKRQHRFITAMAKPAIRVYKSNHEVLPSIVVAQAIIESNWGQSQLYQQAKNPFGIKGSYKGQTKLFPTTEYVNGKEERINAYFRVYPTLEDSILDHDLVVSQKFLPSGVTNYQTAAKLLQTNGYATDPAYARKLINTIKTYSLNRFDGY